MWNNQINLLFDFFSAFACVIKNVVGELAEKVGGHLAEHAQRSKMCYKLYKQS